MLGNVRARHSELQRIEQTLYELGRIHTELAAVVEQQDHPIQAAEASVEETHQNIAEGNIKVKEASKNARNRRKLKWWCALVVVLIIVAIALGVGLGVCSLTQCWDKNK